MAAVLIIPLAFAALFAACRDAPATRFLRALVLLGAAVWCITEGLSVFSAFRFGPVLGCWSVVAAAAAWTAYRRRGQPDAIGPAVDRGVWITLLCAAGVAAILAVTVYTAWVSPPNSADAMAYHAPRVLFWAEQGGVRFFPTPYLNQVMLQPFAEYMNLQTYVLSGSDRFFNLPQWFASAVCAIAVWAIAGELGASRPGRAVAALFSATIPIGILASSGAKNDYVLAMWLAAAVFFTLRWRNTGRPADVWWTGAALGLALYTKATAYLYAPWLLAAIAAGPIFANPRSAARALLPALALAAASNLPLYVRNIDLSGAPMGFDSAQANGYFRWSNDKFGVKPTTSNLLRNLSEQLGARSPAWDNAIYRGVLQAHRWLGIDPNAPATTWRDAVYAQPRNDNHEADAPNPIHLAFLAAVGLFFCIAAARGRPVLPAAYALALVIAFIAFGAYLRWQPFMGRLFLPLFVLGAPLVGLAASMLPPRGQWIVAAPCVFFLLTARLPLLENWVRPLKGPNSILHRSREELYFADMGQFGSQYAAYTAARDLLARSGCHTIGIDAAQFQLEYPLEALLRDVRPGAQFLHVGVDNPSRRYAPPVATPPCAVVCLRCAGNADREARYFRFGTEAHFGDTEVWLAR